VVACGVDGCRAGWCFFVVAHEEIEFGVAATLAELVDRVPDNALILVDIPIGLHDQSDAERSCDLAARRALAPYRASSVFPAPSRSAVYATDYAAAAELNRIAVGKGLTKQSWAICPKIAEVDELLQSQRHLRSRIREVHPEVCFWGLAGGRPMRHSKRSREGFHERLEVLTRYFPAADDVVAKAYYKHGGFEAERDDILDALVATVCSSRIDQCRTLPDDPSTDPTGLPMEMVYLPALSNRDDG
jgi:predicted RNase H-like nuclease